MHSFPVTQGDHEQTVNFDFEEQGGAPVKLGDGSFGAVFRVLDPNGQPYAIKIFYHTGDESSIARYKLEMNAKSKLVNALRLIGLEDLQGNLVLAEAKTNTFLSSDACIHWAEWFKASGISVSDQALIMPLYSCTLKEILEHGAPEGRVVGVEKVQGRGIRGYDILSGLSFRERERVILPILYQLVLGLRALHAGKFSHHDLKPANILVRNAGGKFEVALADFGFLLPNQLKESIKGRFGEALPLGTRHYRSPEQRDYFDICEVDIIASKEKQTRTELLVRDRKFHDTIIEKGDVVVFSKDPERLLHSIEQITHDTDQTARIYLKSGEIPLKPDTRTQVVLYKLHSPRTDLFGIGAVLFDLLTCGRSPERFYDYLRPFDRSSAAVGATSVSADRAGGIGMLMSRYNSLMTAAGVVAGYTAIFEQLRADDFTYPSEDIVRIMLKCFLSRSPDSYCGGLPPENRLDLFLQAQNDIKVAMDSRNAATYMFDSNPLWVGSVPQLLRVGAETSFIDRIRTIQSMSRNDAGKRLVHAYRLLSKIKVAVETTYSQELFFAELSPENLSYVSARGIVERVAPTYPTEAEYFRALNSGDALGMSSGFSAENFVPPCIRFTARSALVTSIPDSSSTPNEVAASSINVSIRYLDSSPFWAPLQRDDLIRIDRQESGFQLYIITQINDTVVTLKKQGSDENQETVLKDARAIVIKRLRPIDYYLSMIGIYLQQLFFVDGVRDPGSLPASLWYLEQAKASGFIEIVLGKRCPIYPERDKTKSNSSADSVKETFDFLAKLYLWLVCGEYKSAEMELQGHNERRVFADLQAGLESLRALLASALGLDHPQELDALGDRQTDEADWKLDWSAEELPTLDELLRRIVSSEISGKIHESRVSSKERHAIVPPRKGWFTRG